MKRSFFFFDAPFENRLALLKSLAASCQELRGAAVKLSARLEMGVMSGGGGFRPASRMIISLSAGLEEVCLRSEPICLLQLCSLLPDVGVLRVITGLWWCSRLCLCAHIHTHTCITHLHVKVESFTWGFVHTHTLSL